MHVCMDAALAVDFILDFIDRSGPSNKIHCQLQPKNTD